MGASMEERKQLLTRPATPVHNLPTTRDVREKAWWARMKKSSLPRFPALSRQWGPSVLFGGRTPEKQAIVPGSETDALPAGLPSPVELSRPVRGAETDAAGHST